MQIKCVIIFNAQVAGWTETYYFVATDITAGIAIGVSLAGSRATLLSQGAYIEGFRLTDDTIPNSGNFYPIPPAFTQARRYQLPRDQWQVSALARISASQQSRQMKMIRGIPDELFFFDVDTGVFRFDDSVNGRFLNFLQVLKSIPCQLKVISKNPTTVNVRPVASGVLSGTGNVTITSPGHGYVALDRVRINRVPGPARRYISGAWTIRVADANTFQFDNVDADVAFSFGAGGMIRRQVYAYANIVDGVLLRTAARKTGKAFFGPRGRR